MTSFDPHNPLIQPHGAQLAMHGYDWLSERDKKAQAKAEATRKKVALSCAKKLEAAADSLNEFLAACRECRDGSGNELQGQSDGRTLLVGNLMEYSGYLEQKYGQRD